MTIPYENPPLFKVGELVGLVSVTRPECNGQYTVERILSPDEVYKARNDGTELRVKCGRNAYLLNKVFVNVQHDCGETCWDESSLRKIHKPSEYSFDQLLTSLKNTDNISSNV